MEGERQTYEPQQQPSYNPQQQYPGQQQQTYQQQPQYQPQQQHYQPQQQQYQPQQPQQQQQQYHQSQPVQYQSQQPIQQPNVVVLQQQQPQYVQPTLNSMTTSYSSVPVSGKCPYCQANVLTTTQKKKGVGFWAVVGIMGITTGCCCIPSLTDACDDTVHYCPRCNGVIGQNKFMC